MRGHTAVMTRPPYAVRIRPDKSTARARALLLRLERDQIQRNRVQVQAQKALVAIIEMMSLMPLDDRANCQKSCEAVKGFLKRIIHRGY